jgi:hypothetical protein
MVFLRSNSFHNRKHNHAGHSITPVCQERRLDALSPVEVSHHLYAMRKEESVGFTTKRNALAGLYRTELHHDGGPQSTLQRI